MVFFKIITPKGKFKSQPEPNKKTLAKKKPLRIGLIGYGFMGRTLNAFRKVPNFLSELNTTTTRCSLCP